MKGDVTLLQEIEDTPLTVKIQLQKKDWTTMDRFLDLERVHTANIQLARSLWTTMDEFLDLVKAHTANIQLARSLWTTMDAFLDLDRDHTANIGLRKYDWFTMDHFLTLDMIHDAQIALQRYNWDTMVQFLGLDRNNVFDAYIKLKKYDWKSVWDFVTGGKTPVVTVDVVLNNASGYKSVPQFVTHKNSASAAPNGYSSEDLPKAAGLAMNAAQSAYMGGSYGSGEVYGNAGNGAVYESGGFEAGTAASAEDMDMLAELMRQGIEYLRQINEKEFTTEVTANSINRANQRVNLRAGKTVVAIGT